jgi:glutaredoxin-like protein NrdH
MPPVVRLYSLSTCGSCRAVKHLLSKTGIAHEIIDMDLLDDSRRKRVMPEFKKANPQGSFPTIVINGRVIVGNDSKAILEALYL